MQMSRAERNPEEVARLGEEVYARSVRAKVEGEARGANDGRFVALDIESGDYEVADGALSATAGLRSRRPNAVFYLTRVGRRAAFRMRGGSGNSPVPKAEPGRSSS
jgi:hypothetical protein